MKKRNRAVALLAAGAALVAVGVPVAASTAAGPGEVVKVKSTVTLGAVGYRGKVKSANGNCVGERKVVLKQKGVGVISRATSKENGNWTADLDELNDRIRIPADVFAEVKPITQATAGPIYRCLKARSKTVTISGG